MLFNDSPKMILQKFAITYNAAYKGETKQFLTERNLFKKLEALIGLNYGIFDIAFSSKHKITKNKEIDLFKPFFYKSNIEECNTKNNCQNLLDQLLTIVKFSK